MLAILGQKDQSDLVKMWACAALTRSTERGALESLLSRGQGDSSVRTVIARSLASLKKAPLHALVRCSLKAKQDSVRRYALQCFAAVKDGSNGEKAFSIYQKHLDPKAADGIAPWLGGALYFPRIQWSQKQAKQMSILLVRWLNEFEKSGNENLARQLKNCLRDFSWRLGTRVNHQGQAVDWLRAFLKMEGEDPNAIGDQPSHQLIALLLSKLD